MLAQVLHEAPAELGQVAGTQQVDRHNCVDASMRDQLHGRLLKRAKADDSGHRECRHARVMPSHITSPSEQCGSFPHGSRPRSLSIVPERGCRGEYSYIMNGIQVSVSWAVTQAAEALAASSHQAERDAGRSLRCCEVAGLDHAGKAERERGTQGVRVTLRFYRKPDLKAVDTARSRVALSISRALGLYKGAVQLDLDLLADDGTWLGFRRGYKRGGTGLRLDRYLTTEVLEDLEAKHGNADWRYLAERPAEVKILLRRLRYRFGEDYGANERTRSYAYWTTGTTHEWAQAGGHELNYLVNRLSGWSPHLNQGHADHADRLHPSYWGEVDTEQDPLRVLQMTTENGTTAEDVRAVLNHAGVQIWHAEPHKVTTDKKTNRTDPLAPFVDGLKDLLTRPSTLRRTDLLLVHRGGGVHPASRHGVGNVPNSRKQELLKLCTKVRDMGVEVVVALGHANVSVLLSPGLTTGRLPLGLFEATTPTAGAAWILQEHVNPRLVDTGLIYSQPPSE